MARLPIPGSDDGSWGDILNAYLLQSLTADGSIRTGAVGSPQLADNAVTSAKLAPSAVTSSHLSTGSVTNSAIADGAIAQGKIANLSGDLAGKASTAHTHSIADTTSLQTTLDSKAASVHTHTASQISDASTAGRSLMTAADAATQRSALGLGSAATLTVGTTAGTVAAGDDSRITGAQSAATLDADVAALVGDGGSSVGSGLAATFARTQAAQPFGWASPRSATIGTAPAGNTPTITQFDANAGGRPYTPANLAYDTALVNHPAGVYASTVVDSKTVLVNTCNLPATDVQEAYHEFMLSGADVAVWAYSGGTANGTRRMRVVVDGQLAAEVEPSVAGSFHLQLVFPFSTVRRIRVEFYDIFFRGMNLPTTSAIYPPSSNPVRVAFYGDSWVAGSGGLKYYELTPYLLAQSLGWEVARMGHGGSGYVTDGSGASAPLTDTTRLGKLATLAPDYAIIQGSINDSTATPAQVTTAVTTILDYLATNSPRTKVVLVGPQPVANNSFAPPATSLANAAALSAVAATAPNVVRFLDPIDGQWLTDAGDYLGDLVHPTAGGHAKWATRLVTELVRP